MKNTKRHTSVHVNFDIYSITFMLTDIYWLGVAYILYFTSRHWEILKYCKIMRGI